jgi:hypothetical protein
MVTLLSRGSPIDEIGAVLFASNHSAVSCQRWKIARNFPSLQIGLPICGGRPLTILLMTLWFGVCELHLTSSSTEVSLRRVKETSKAMSAPSSSRQKPDVAGEAFPR